MRAGSRRGWHHSNKGGRGYPRGRKKGYVALAQGRVVEKDAKDQGIKK